MGSDGQKMFIADGVQFSTFGGKVDERNRIHSPLLCVKHVRAT